LRPDFSDGEGSFSLRSSHAGQQVRTLTDLAQLDDLFVRAAAASRLILRIWLI
jgi:hypothetical protein